jgi:hypothetical protein
MQGTPPKETTMRTHLDATAAAQLRPERWALFVIGMALAASAGALAGHLHAAAGSDQGTVQVSAAAATGRDATPPHSVDGPREPLPAIYRGIRPAGAEQTIPAAETWPAP